jgi:hypothetical protein
VPLDLIQGTELREFFSLCGPTVAHSSGVGKTQAGSLSLRGRTARRFQI